MNPISTPALILTLGVPRSGTILVYNIVREILERRGVGYRAANTNYPETERVLGAYDFRRRLLLHAHNMLPTVERAAADPRTLAFFNYRDPRDVVVSMMGLHDVPFERAVELVEISFRHLDRARRHGRVKLIRYETLVADVAPWISHLGETLGLKLEPAEVEAVRAATSPEAHRAIMTAVAAGKVEVQARQNPRRLLRESRRHFINDRHMQSGRCGRWRDELDADQQAEAGTRLRRWLVELGYEAPGKGTG